MNKSITCFTLFFLIISCKKEDGLWNLKRNNHIDFNSCELKLIGSKPGFRFSGGQVEFFQTDFSNETIMTYPINGEAYWWAGGPVVSIDGIEYTYDYSSPGMSWYHRQISNSLINSNDNYDYLKFNYLIPKGIHSVTLKFVEYSGSIEKIEFWSR